MNNGQLVFITAQKQPLDNDPRPDELFKTGVFAKIMQMTTISDSYLRVVIKGFSRAKAIKFRDMETYYSADIRILESKPVKSPLRSEALINMAVDAMEEYASLNPRLPQDILFSVKNLQEPGRVADFVADNVLRDYKSKQIVLEALDEEDRIDFACT